MQGDLWTRPCALGLGLGQVKGAKAQPRMGRLLEAPVRALSASRGRLLLQLWPLPSSPVTRHLSSSAGIVSSRPPVALSRGSPTGFT